MGPNFRPSLGTLGTTAPLASPEALKQCQEAFARKAEVLKSVWEAQGGCFGRPMVEGELAAEAGIGEICVVRASVIRGTQRKENRKSLLPNRSENRVRTSKIKQA